MDFDKPDAGHVIVERLAWLALARLSHRPFVRGLDLRGDEAVMELGCGGGLMTRCVADALPDGRVTAVDTSRYWADIAHRRLGQRENVEIVCGDLREAAIDDGSQDLAIVHFVLHDIDAELRVPTMQVLAAKLRPEGRLHVKDPTREGHGLTADDIRALMAEVGLHELSAARSRSIIMGPIYYGVFGR